MSERAASTGKPEPQLAKAKDHPGQVKETLISLIIAFIMAFVFRAFVAEAFIIPTGSMAPTLLGQHSRHQSPPTGEPLSSWILFDGGTNLVIGGEPVKGG